VRQHFVPRRDQLQWQANDVGQVGRDQKEEERKLASIPFAELRDAEVPSEHQRVARLCNSNGRSWPGTNVRSIPVIAAAGGIEVAPGSLDSTGWPMSDGRLDALRRDLETRIRPLVPDLSNEEFQALIERMAQLQYKYEARRAEDFFDRQAAEDRDARR
jgi:hypothetical protein